MPVIVEIANLEKVKTELLENDSNDRRSWTQYKCTSCGHKVASDIAFQSLCCIKCGANMSEVKVGDEVYAGS